MTEDEIKALFTGRDGAYRFARWGRPIAPVVFGVDDKTLETVKGAIEAVTTMAGHQMAETDPELGVNLMMFFLRDWDELLEIDNLDKLIPDLPDRVAALKKAGANQYRFFRFEHEGAIQAAFTFVRIDAALADIPADVLSLDQVVRLILMWSPEAFRDKGPLAKNPEDGVTYLRPEIAQLIRAAYDPVMPARAEDDSHALRLLARIEAEGAE